MTGDQDHRNFRIDRTDLRKKLQAIGPRHADIGHQDPGKVAIEHRERAFGVRECMHADVLQLQQLHIGSTKLLVIVNEDDPLLSIEECHARLRHSRKAAPPNTERTIRSSPPNSRAISRAIPSPSPSPSGRPVTNGVKI